MILSAVSARTMVRPTPTSRSLNGAMTRSVNETSISAVSSLGAELIAWTAATDRLTARFSLVRTPMMEKAMTTPPKSSSAPRPRNNGRCHRHTSIFVSLAMTNCPIASRAMATPTITKPMPVV